MEMIEGLLTFHPVALNIKHGFIFAHVAEKAA